MRKYLLIIIPVLLLVTEQRASAQMLYDTSYVKKYYNLAAWSIYQNVYSNSYALHQNYSLTPDVKKTSDLNFVAESFKQVGISRAKNKNYWAVNLFGTLTDNAERKPTSNSLNILYGYSDYRYNFEISTNWFKGYYESNSANYTPSFTDSSKYNAPKGMRSFSANAKYMHFFNYKKFSYSAAYRGTTKQRKSAGTTLLYGDVSYTNLKSDSGFIPAPVRSYYSDRAYLKGALAVNLTLGAGVTGTLVVFKNLFINALVFAGPGLLVQSTSYQRDQKDKLVNATWGVSGGLRFALGLSFERFFIYNTTIYNVNYFQVDKIDVTNTFFTNSFNVGYRFWKRK